MSEILATWIGNLQTYLVSLTSWGDLLFLIIMALAIFTGAALYATFGGWGERKLIGRTHSRIGPQYTGPFGLLQTVADLLKFLQKEVLFPRNADLFVFKIAPLLLVVPTYLTFLFLPIGSFMVLENEYSLIFVLALLSIAPIAILLAAWASNSKYSTLGGLRAAGMMMSYEVLLVLAIASVAIHTGSLSILGIAQWQSSHGWLLLFQPVAFVLFMIGIIAAVERNPFDLVEAESELVSGWRTEYGGVYFALTLLAEYIKVLASAILCGVLFFGAWVGAWGEVRLAIVVIAFTALMFYIRATAMRMRLDQVFAKVWRGLIPLALLNIIATFAWRALA